MKLITQVTTTTIVVNISVELASHEEARDFLSYVRAYGKSGIQVDPITGQQRPVRNIEKAPTEVENLRGLILTLADEVDGITSVGIITNAKTLGYNLNKNTLSAALHALKANGKLRVIGKETGLTNRERFVYQTVKTVEVP